MTPTPGITHSFCLGDDDVCRCDSLLFVTLLLFFLSVADHFKRTFKMALHTVYISFPTPRPDPGLLMYQLRLAIFIPYNVGNNPWC